MAGDKPVTSRVLPEHRPVFDGDINCRCKHGHTILSFILSDGVRRGSFLRGLAPGRFDHPLLAGLLGDAVERLLALKPFAFRSGEHAVPWCTSGFYLEERPTFTFDPLFHAGCYYAVSYTHLDVYKRQISLRAMIICPVYPGHHAGIYPFCIFYFRTVSYTHLLHLS